MNDAEKLNLLADWFDAEATSGRWGNDEPEVQRDLRDLARRISAIYDLLMLYRLKRKYDGLNGRVWDASKHMHYEDQIAAEENRREPPNKPVEPTADVECVWCGNNMTNKSFCERCGF